MTAEAVNSHAGDDLPPKRSRGGVTSGASLGCEAVDSHAGDDLPPKRSRGGVTSGAAHRLRSRRFSLQLKKKLCINPMQQLLF